MSLVTRAREVEERHLSPKEAVLLWMKEAHEFGSFYSYGSWLMDQPRAAYPLVRLPQQVVATVRTKSKGERGEELQQKLYRAQKDVIFLFYLHRHLNQRALLEEEARHLRQELLSQRLRTLLYGTYSLDRDRLDEFELSPDLGQSPSRERTRERLALEADITTWPRDEALLRGEVLALLGAERLLSERYFSGEPLLYPDMASGLAAILGSLDSLVELYEAILEGRPPESDEEFARWLSGEQRRMTPSAPDPEAESDRLRPNPRRAALALAEHTVMLARAEALADLGEWSASTGLVRASVRGQQAV